MKLAYQINVGVKIPVNYVLANTFAMKMSVKSNVQHCLNTLTMNASVTPQHCVKKMRCVRIIPVKIFLLPVHWMLKLLQKKVALVHIVKLYV